MNESATTETPFLEPSSACLRESSVCAVQAREVLQ